MSGYLGGYLGLVTSSSEDVVEVGPDPIPVTDTLGASVPRLDIVSQALDRLCDYLRP